MIIKLEISSRDDMAELIKIFGMQGYKAWREQMQRAYWEEKKYYFVLEIPVDDDTVKIIKDEEATDGNKNNPDL